MTELAIIKNVSKSYSEFKLKNISFALKRGTVTGIIGPNGAGKSTTIKILTDLVKRDTGQVEICGLNYNKNSKEIKNILGYVGEEQYFYSDKTVKWTERFVSSFYDNWDSSKFKNMISMFNISSNKKIKELSKGMKVKLALAIALSHNPKVVVLDEPTSGLDPIVRHEVLSILKSFANDKNHAVLFSSHITQDLHKIADHLVFILDGEIVLSGTKEDILNNYKTDDIDEILLTLKRKRNV